MQPNPQQPILAITAIACILISTALVVALHLLRPDLNPISRYESEYAIGPYNALMTIVFMLRGAAAIALAVGLYFGVSAEGRSLIGLALLGAFGIGMWTLAVFPTDPPNTPATFAGEVHNWVALAAFVSVSLGSLLVSWSLRNDPQWAGFQPLALVLAIAVTASCLFFYLAPWIRINGVSGLTERIFIGLALLWMLLVAFRLR